MYNKITKIKYFFKILEVHNIMMNFSEVPLVYII